LHVLNRLERGGVEMRLLDVMGRLCPSEFHADVCALSGLEGSLDARVRACGGDVIPMRFDARFPHRFVRFLRRHKYDVVHSHVLYGSGVILLLAALGGVPVRIAHFRGMSDHRRSTWIRHLQRRVLRDLIDRYATNIVGCGEGAMDATWRADWRSDSRCRIIYTALDPSRFEPYVDRARVRAELGLRSTAPVFIHVGNEVPAKNHTRLLTIFSEISKRDPMSWLVLVGAGTSNPEGISWKAIRRWQLSTRVMPLGVRDDVPRLLKAADVLLLPSLAEGVPGAVLEACIAGIPVLASDLPGVREIAVRLPQVHYLPLTVSDADWAAAAIRLLDEDLQRSSETGAQVFRASVFHLDRAVEEHRLLWGRRVSTDLTAATNVVT
jgi:glycosyltransferase involved in cell wall biosynthesis